MGKSYIVNCYTCQHNGQETCKGCNTLLVGENEPYENWQLREDLAEKDQRISELEEQLKNATHKFNIYQEVYYLDYKYKFEPYVSKYLTVCKGKILDIILREEGCVDYNFTLDDLKWIQEENCFATKEEAQAKLEELKGENK